MLIIILTALLVISSAEVKAEEKGNYQCLACHSKREIIIEFENGETTSGYVNPEEFEESVHSDLRCEDCHREFQEGKHPKRSFRSLEQYRRTMAINCRGCHLEEDICTKPIHARLKAKEGVLTAICMDCHGAHSIKRVGGGEIFESEKRYCMNCHSRDLRMTFYNGDPLPLRVSLVEIEQSVHSKLICSDCHRWFSMEEHPERHFRSKRDYVIAQSEVCKRCHFDKYSKILESIHYRLLAQGNSRAPVCIDCHGGHDVAEVSQNKAVLLQKCRNCHPDVYNTYLNSIHGRALIELSVQDVPICIDCHRAHDIENPLAVEFHERIPEMCGNCHANKALMKKYGLSTEVVKTYLSDFHGVTLGFYKKQRETLYKPMRPIAVCTDCHGVHDISSTRYQDRETIKQNLVNRCRKCHTEANQNFPDAWLSHYEPSLNRAPCIYLVNLFYRIFIPFMFIGLCLQIVLHIWRYAVNR